MHGDVIARGLDFPEAAAVVGLLGSSLTDTAQDEGNFARSSLLSGSWVTVATWMRVSTCESAIWLLSISC